MRANRSRSNMTGLVLACLVLGSSFVGCPLLRKKASADAGDEDLAGLATLLDAATVGSKGVGAKNEADVLRYANETPLNNEPAVIGDAGAKARNFPGNGPEVAFLPKGTAVAKIAQYFSTATLIMFDDPSGDGSKLLGWVTTKAFDTAAPAPTKVIVPPTIKPDAGVAIKDAGAGVQDAGVVVVKDAGTVVVDAGGGPNATPPPPPKGAVAVPPTNGKCPDGWALAESLCRRKCATDADCPRGTGRCQTKTGGVKVCSTG